MSIGLELSPYSFGVNFVISDISLFWNIGTDFRFGSLVISCDKYIIDGMLFPAKDFVKFDWYAGIGAFSHIEFFSILSSPVGLRFPIGLSIHILKQLELFLTVSQYLWLSFPDKIYINYFITLSYGFRLWL